MRWEIRFRQRSARRRPERRLDALLSGDYGRAAEVLRPLAERSAQPDQAAEFFMGTLYENGLGVRSDITRACALYARAAAGVNGPLAETAQKLLEPLRSSTTREAFSDCLLLVNAGLDSRFEPASFTLAPGYTMSLDLRGATITRNGRETRKEGLLVVHNGVFLPIRYTQLRAGPQRATTRHFMEASIWQPGSNGRWILTWNLFEAVEDDLVSVDRRTVAEADVDPRDADPVDIRDFAGISVNARGDVEWKVFSGPDAGSGTIVTPDERAAAQQRDRARREAEERVHWERHLDATRRPSLTYIDGGGCAHIFVYGWSPDRAEDITIRASKAALGLSTAAQTFDLGAPPAGLEVTIHVYDRAVRH